MLPQSPYLRGSASGVRWQVLGGLVGLSFLTIVDRVCIAAAKHDIASELGLADQTFGFVFGAFALGYAVFMAPAGWAADRLGARRFLAAIVTLWSVCTVATGAAMAAAPLIAIRLLFGAAEAGAYPTAARAIYSWLPRSERGLALGLLNTGSRLGAAIGLSLTSAAIAAVGWRASFCLLGAAGLLWAAWWRWWYRDDPARKRGVSAVELAKIRGDASAATPVPAVAPDRPLVTLDSALVILQYFCSNFTFFLCFSWLMPYLRERFALTANEAALYASAPLYCGALATWTSGIAVDALFRRGQWSLSRRLPAMAGFALAAACLMAALRCQTASSFLLCFSLTTFGVDFTLSPSWSAASDLGGRRTGTLSAAMNTMGSVGAFASSVTFPWLLARAGSISAYFALAAALNVIAIGFWWRVRLAPAAQAKGV
jgi:ACS family glucarate transporter-like MFS transporter